MKISERQNAKPVVRQLTMQDRNTLTIVSVGLVISFAATLLAAYLSLRYSDWQFIALFAVIAILTISDLASTSLVRMGKQWAVWLFIIPGQITLTAVGVLISGIGLLGLVSLLALTFLVAVQTLPPRQTRWAVSLGFIFGFFAGIADWLGPGFQVAAPAEIKIIIPVLIILTTVAYGILFIRSFRTLSLSSQLVSTFIAVSSLSIAAVTFFSAQYIGRLFTLDANFRLYATLLGLVIVGLAALGGYRMAQMVTTPITHLTEIARQVAAGNLSVQAPIEAGNELGALAKAFNAMTSQLMATLEGLEQRITDRTQELEHRAIQLRASAEVGNAIASIRVLDELLPKISQLISERFGFYHVGIFLLDPSGDFAILRAANSQGGQRMLDHGHKLKIGEVGIVGYVTSTKKPRIAMDVGQDAVFFNNPDLPETRSEMALPLVVGDQVLGALDVQSKEPGAFAQEDIATLQLLADQVAVAIENARLFSASQTSLEAMRRSYGELSREAWAKMLHDRPEFGVLANHFDILYTPSGAWAPEMLQAAQSGEMISTGDGTVAIPIKDREHILGTLRLRKPGGYPWSKEEISLAETLAQQLYLALENARLYRETQRRAERERLAGDITAKMRRSNDPQEILQTAVHELRQALNLHQGGPSPKPVLTTPETGLDGGSSTPNQPEEGQL